ncbi:hypothetical protein KJ678_04030 [Patescibacteria group bacterium]|nr:hypothetical protein [Patescibacteria group bacterium]
MKYVTAIFKGWIFLYAVLNFYYHLFGRFLEVKFWLFFVKRDYLVLLKRPIQVSVAGWLLIFAIAVILWFFGYWPKSRPHLTLIGYGFVVILLYFYIPA